MKVLVACEFSGIVREAFRKKGHDAWSCDLLPTEIPGPHYQGDVFDIINSEFDLIIAHPPCTYICVSGNRYYAGTDLRKNAADFIMKIWKVKCNKLCIENPVGQLNKYCPELPKPQYIQPWQYGHGETKKTGLWKRGLPDLKPTSIVSGRANRIWRMSPGPERGKERSRFFSGIAEAMAEQWG